MFRRSHNRRGFTLVELIVTAAILGILALLAGVTYSSLKQMSAERVAVSLADQIYRNAEAQAAFQGTPASDVELESASTDEIYIPAGSGAASMTVTFDDPTPGSVIPTEIADSLVIVVVTLSDGPEVEVTPTAGGVSSSIVIAADGPTTTTTPPTTTTIPPTTTPPPPPASAWWLTCVFPEPFANPNDCGEVENGNRNILYTSGSGGSVYWKGFGVEVQYDLPGAWYACYAYKHVNTPTVCSFARAFRETALPNGNYVPQVAQSSIAAGTQQYVFLIETNDCTASNPPGPPQ